MRALRFFLIFLVVGWLVGEVAIDRLAEARIEDQVAERSEGVAGVDAQIDAFPPVARLAFSGSVSKITVTLQEVERLRLTFTEIGFEFHGLDMDRFALLTGDIKVTGLDEGVFTVTVTADELSRALGRTVSLAGANVRSNGAFIFTGSATIQLPQDLLPCDPEARVEEDAIVATCTFTEVPEVIFEEAEGFG